MIMIVQAALVVAISITPLLAAAETYRSAIEDGKTYGATVNSQATSASSINPDAVPGYLTSNPTEASYYGNPSSIEDAAAEAAATNEAAKTVSEGFVSRPMFTIDQSTDPMFALKNQVEANAASIAGMMQGEYSSCQPVVLETPYPPDLERCYENRLSENHTCNRKLVVACDPEKDGCDQGGIVPNSWGGDMKVVFFATGNGDYVLQFGTIADNYWPGYGTIYDRTMKFQIKDVNVISRIALTRAAFDDWLMVQVNGHTVYVGPYGGDRLNVVNDCAPDAWFCYTRIQYCATCYGSPELGTSWNKSLNIDIKPYLVDGDNTIFMRTIVAGKGEGAIQLTTRQLCPRECKDVWDDSLCSTLQSRSQ